MNTIAKLLAYRNELTRWKAALRAGYPAKKPEPAEYGLKTKRERWMADNLRFEKESR